MNTNSQDWMELDYLTGRINELRSLYRMAIGGGAQRTIKHEIEEREVQRQRLVNSLSKHLAVRVTASSAPAASRSEAATG